MMRLIVYMVAFVVIKYIANENGENIYNFW